MAASEVGSETGKRIVSRKKRDSTAEEPVENGIDTDEDFSDPEGYVDNIKDEDLLPDLLRQRPKEADGIDSVVVVDNIPKVGKERLEKLMNVIRKIFTKFGTIVNEFYPKDDEGLTKGYIFLEFTNENEANLAVKSCNGYPLDKQHTFACNMFSDFDKYADVPDEWEPPEPKLYTDVGSLGWYLSDRSCCNQYSVIYEEGFKTAIMLNAPRGPKKLEEKVRWTETLVRWSPKGTYLSTFHEKGIALWAGEKFQRVMRFAHPNVQFIDFSPCERYVVTFSPTVMNSVESTSNTIFWCVRTGQQKRAFHIENARMWPVFRWSPTGKYFGRVTPDAISIYETPSFGLLEKKSIKVDGVRDLGWSPSDDVLAFWVEEKENVPSRVVLMEIPSRRELRVKNLFNVADCRMYWQNGGTYLCVKVDRYAKRKEEKGEVKYSGITHQLEIFRIREKQIPVDTIEIKDSISAFEWEPNGHKFAVIHGESPRISVSFYNVKPKVDKLKTFEKKLANCLFWSPTGQIIIIAGLKTMNGQLEFVDTSDMTVMKVAEHFMATDVEWDPTGRYVITVVSHWMHKVDNAYFLWSFQGKELQKHALDKVCQVLWRPRPPCLLSSATLKSLKKTYMKKYGNQFAVEDAVRLSDTAKEILERRQQLRRSYLSYRGEREEDALRYEEKRKELRKLSRGDTEDSGEPMEEEKIEFLVKEEEIIIEEELE